MKLFASLIAVIATLAVLFAGSASAFAHSGVAVQLFEWSWADVATECENFLGPKGFGAVQVSPPMEHIKGSEWWTRYQPVTYKIISRSGDESAFRSMISRCKASNVSIIVDSVINHMAAGSGTGVGGSSYSSRTFPIYSPSDFHHNSNNEMTNCQVNNYADKNNVQSCDLVGLPDLATASSYVQSQIRGYLMNLYNMGVRGFRIDAAKHQDAGELKTLLSTLPSDAYIGQEVIGASGEAVQPSMYTSIGQVSEFYYADNLDSNIKTSGKMKYLETFGESWGMLPDASAAVFLDNHDTQRNGRAQLTYKDGNLYTFANIFMLAWPYGSVRVMSSYYFPSSNTDLGPPSVGVENGKYCDDGQHWVCEHRRTAIANMVGWRKAVGTSSVASWQNGDNNNRIAFNRGNKGFIAMNRDDNASWSTKLQTGLPAGNYCNVIVSDDVNSCPTIVVGSDGYASFTVPSLSAIAIHVNKKHA